MVTPKPQLIDDVLAYGEVDVARALVDLPGDQFIQIYKRADWYLYNTETPSGESILFAMANALAAVEVVEGSPRDLKRKRRNLKKVPALRKQIGLE